METLMTFDAGRASLLRRELTRGGYREGTDYRIGMTEEGSRLTLRARRDGREGMLTRDAERILRACLPHHRQG